MSAHNPNKPRKPEVARKPKRPGSRPQPGRKPPRTPLAAAAWWKPAEPTGRVLDLDAESAGGTRLQELQREMLAKYGERPITEGVERFCNRQGIAASTWYRWRHDPDFAAALEEVQRQRARINLDRMHEGVEALDSRVMMDAIDGNTTAQVTAYRRLGFIREGATQVQINRVDGDPMSDEAIAKLEERLAENLRIVTEYPQDKPKVEEAQDGEV